MAGIRERFSVFVLGTSRDDTSVLLVDMSRCTALQAVTLYNGQGARQGQLQAAQLSEEMNLRTNVQFSTSSDLSDIKKCDLCIFWGYSFLEAKGENLVAVRKLMISLVDELCDMESPPVILFPDGMSGIIYANLLKLVMSEESELKAQQLQIRVISSISLMGRVVFGASERAARVWPTSQDGFYVESGENEENYGELDFYRECVKQNRRPLIAEGHAMAEATKLICVGGDKVDFDKSLGQRMKVVGRVPSNREANELEMEIPFPIVFLTAVDSEDNELPHEVKQIIKNTEEEVKNILKYFQ